MSGGPQCRRRPWRLLSTLAFGVATGTAAMLLSYGLVRLLTQDVVTPQAPKSREVSEKQRLLAVAEHLGGLAERFAEQMPLDSVGYTPDAQRWVQLVFCPELDALRRELEDPVLAEHPVARVLREAIERCLSLAEHPDDLELRRQALLSMQAADQAAWEELTEAEVP